jgi:hypothetical protein
MVFSDPGFDFGLRLGHALSSSRDAAAGAAAEAGRNCEESRLARAARQPVEKIEERKPRNGAASSRF